MLSHRISSVCRSTALAVALAFCFGLIPSNSFGQEPTSEETQPIAERNFGDVAAQREWLKMPPLPDWTEKKRFVANGVEHLVAGTAPFMTPAEAEADLDREIERVAREWIRDRFSTEAAESIELNVRKIRNEWMVEHQAVPCMFQLPSGEADSSYPMYCSFAQLAMTENVVEQVSEMWDKKQIELRDLRRRGTLITWSILGGALLALLAGVHSYLRMDYLTRGYHTGKLRLVFGLSLAAIIALAIVLLNILK